MLTAQQARNVLKKGSFSCPANKRYNGTVTVSCDFCNRGNLSACIGYGEHDICLTCADDLTKDNTPMTGIQALTDLPAKSKPRQFPPARTFMLTSHTVPQRLPYPRPLPAPCPDYFPDGTPTLMMVSHTVPGPAPEPFSSGACGSSGPAPSQTKVITYTPPVDPLRVARMLAPHTRPKPMPKTKMLERHTRPHVNRDVPSTDELLAQLSLDPTKSIFPEANPKDNDRKNK